MIPFTDILYANSESTNCGASSSICEYGRLFYKARNTTEDFVDVGSKAFIHPVVDDRIDAGVAHSKEVKKEKKMTNIWRSHNGRYMVDINEIDMIGSPANHKD